MENSTFKESEYLGPRNDTLARIEILLLSGIFIAILVSNLFVLVALSRSSLIRPLSRTYLFMLHISIADLLVGLFSVLPQLCWDITYKFYGTNWLCKAVKWLQLMPIYLSSLLLVFMAIDRYRAIIWRRGSGYALGVNSSKKVVLLMVGAAWIGASLLAFPQLLIFSQQKLKDGSWDCWATLSDRGSKAYVIYYFIVAFALPLVIIAFCYIFIVVKMWQFTRYKKGYRPLRQIVLYHVCCLSRTGATEPFHERASETSSASTSISYRYSCRSTPDWKISDSNVPQPLSRAKLKTIKLTFVIVFAFIVCNAPFCFAQLYFVFKSYDEEEKANDASKSLAILMLLLPSLPSIANPWIYFTFSKSLIDQIKTCIWGTKIRSRQKRESIGDKEPDDRKCSYVTKLPCTPPEHRSPKKNMFANFTVNIQTIDDIEQSMQSDQ